MGKQLCDYCGDNSYMLFPCKQCGKSFCARHRLPEKHGCIPGVSTDASTSAFVPSYADQDYTFAQSQQDGPREYVWEPNVTELPKDPFNPKTGIVLKGVFWPGGKELFHVALASCVMFIVFYLTTSQYFAFRGVLIAGSETGYFSSMERTVFPIIVASIATSGFMIHEFAHRQVGRQYKLPAKFRLLTIGIIITIFGLVMFLATDGQFPPFALPGAVVVIGLENRDQAGKCKIAGPLSNFIISLVLLPMFLVFISADVKFALVLLIGAYVNTFLGVFNMLPIGMLDGRNIISWKKKAYFPLMFALVLMLAIEIYFLTTMRFVL